MKLGRNDTSRVRCVLGYGVALVGALAWFGALAPAAGAAPVPVQVKVSNLWTAQTYNLDKQGTDNVYLLVSGVAKGEEVQKRFPESGTLEAARKKMAVKSDEPLTLWKGELGDGEFALLTAVLIHDAKGDPAKTKEFADALAAAAKKSDLRSKKALATKAEFGKLAAATLAAQQEVVTDVKKTLSRQNKTDHYGGLFNVVVWNNNGKIVKRIDPAGLTFGEHYGDRVKAYTKIKKTLKNVLTEEGGQWSEDKLQPLGEDEKAIRVKMLETEFVKTPERTARNVIDYIAEVQVLAANKPVRWSLGDEKPPKESGDPETHTYWEFAE